MSDAGFTINAEVEADFDQLGASLAAEIKKSGAKGSADFDRIWQKSAQQLQRSLGRALASTTTDATKAARALTSGFKLAGMEAEDMRRDVQAMSRLLEAQQNNRFIDPNQFALLRRLQSGLLETQRIIARTDFSNPAAARAARAALDVQRRAINSANITLQSTVKQSTATIIEEERRRTLAARTEANQRTALARGEATQASAIQRRQQDQILVATQRAARQRVQITRFALESLGRAEKAFGALVTGIARTSSSAVSRLYGDSLGRVSSLIRRQNSQVNSITQSGFTTRNSIFRSNLSRQERLVQQSMTRQTQIIRSAQAQAQAGVVGAARRSSLLGLGGGLAGLGVLSLGLERFSNIERLTKQFTALTGSAEDAAIVLEQVKEFARSTPFDLVGVADLAKGFLAIKTPLDQVLPRVRAIADAVALTGGGVEELNRIQRAIGQVVSTGKLQGDELNQLAENLPGLNIRQLLADQLTGGNVQALVELQAAGDISGEAFVNGFITGLQGDERLVGASEDLAKTLGGRLANLKEVVADVGAAFIGLIADPLKEATRLATIALDNLSAFIKGEISPAMQVLRTAVGGAAAAIGTLLVAKVAGEAIKILATSARLLLTPFGIIVATIGAVGAAFAVLRDRSEEFRDVTDRLGRFLQTTFGNVMDAIGETVGRVVEAFSKAKEPITGTADALERGLEPARSWISEVGTRLADAIATAGRFLTDTLIPALGDFAIFIGKNAGPALGAFRDIVVDLGSRGLDLLKAGFERLEPVLKRVNEFAKEVGESIRGVVEGADSLKSLIPTGAAILGGGLVAGPIGALVAGAAVGFATLSPTIRGFIVDGFQTAMATVSSFFRNFDWGGLAGGALEFVRRVGRIIGTIVSSREFVTAVLAIGAAAVAVGAKFVQGFAEGVISNIPELADLGLDIGEAILGGITGFITNPSNFVSVLGGLAAVFAGTQLLGAFRSRGQEAGQSFLTGFRGNFRGGQDFLSSALGLGGLGSNFKRNLTKSISEAQSLLDAELRRNNRVFAAVGQGQVAGGALSGRATNASIEESRRRFQDLETQIGRAGLAGLAFRTNLSGSLRAVNGAIGQVISSVTGRSGLGSSLSNLGSSISTGFRDVAATLRGQGRAIGTALGVGVVAGFGAAAGGKQLGSGNVTGGIGTILASSLAAGLATGSPVVAGAVAGVGLISAAFTAGGQKARDFETAVRNISDALEGINDLSGEQAAGAIDQILRGEFKKEAADIQQILIDVGFTTAGLADELVRLGSSGASSISALRGPFDAIADSIAGFGLTEDLALLSDEIATIGAISPGVASQLQQLVDSLADGSITQGQFAAATDELFDSLREGGAGLTDAERLAKGFGEGVKGATEAVKDLQDQDRGVSGLGRGLEGATTLTEDLQGALETAKTAADALFNPTEGTFATTVQGLILSLEGVASGVGGGLAAQAAGRDVAGGAQVAQSLAGLDQDIAEIVKKGIEDGASEAQIDEALALATIAVGQLDAPPEVIAALQTRLNEAIAKDAIPVDVQAVADTEAAQQAGRDIAAAAKEGADDSSLRSTGEDIGDGFAEGLRNKLGAVQAAARALADAAVQATRKLVGAQSPATEFIDIGNDVVDGFTLGIINNLGFVEAAGTQMGNTFRDATVEAVARLNEEIAALRPDLFASILGGGASRDSALRGVQDTLRSLTDELVSSLTEAPGNFSIDFGAGLDNRNALAEVAEGLKEFGANLLQSGASVGEVIAAVLQKRTEALNIAAFLGFDPAVVDEFFNGLGLSAAGLQQFGTELASETERLKTQAEKDEAARRKEEADRAKAESEDAAADAAPTIGELNVNLALPFGDPEAVALAVANRTVAAVRTR